MAEKKKPAEEAPDTPSGKALEKVGPAPELKHNNVEQVLEHGEKYQAEKKKHRWG